MKTMRQVVFAGTGGPEVIRIQTAPVPQPGAGKVLVEVVAFGLNRGDCIQRSGTYPPPPGETEVPGLEMSGRVVALGPNVTTLKVGEEICALVGSGAYAEYCVAEAALCLPRPTALSLLEAGGVPETSFTVFDNVFTRGRLKKGETFLVHGGSSGIGETAIMLAKQFGATVIATAGTDAKCAFCRASGADYAINYRALDFVDEINRITQGRGIDVILDSIGGPYFQKNISILAVEGRLVEIYFMLGSVVKDFNYLPLMLKRLTVTGSTLRSRTLEQKTAVAVAVKERVWPLYDSGKVRPKIYEVFSMEDTAKAHAVMESSAHCGKILLTTGK